MLPLLHIGDTVTSTTVDPRALALGIIALLALVLLIWVPFRVPGRLSQHLGPPLLCLVVAAAVLPSVVPYDHWLRANHPEAHTEIHASHCHIAPGSCADAPVAAGIGQFLLSEPLLPVPALVSFALILSVPALVGISRRPPTRPPLASFA